MDDAIITLPHRILKDRAEASPFHKRLRLDFQAESAHSVYFEVSWNAQPQDTGTNMKRMDD